MGRISIDEYYLNIAAAVAIRSTCLRRKYGAIIVKDNEIIATGYNGSPRGMINCSDLGSCSRLGAEHGEGYHTCKSVHAEQNAIISAPRWRMLDSALYLVCIKDGEELTDIEPCDICMRMIKNAGIKNIIMRERTITV